MLTLPIKKQWFRMIMTGEKREEYREIKPYYTERFKNVFLLDKDGDPTGANCAVCLRNGYSPVSPKILADVSLRIGTGDPKWGAKSGKEYYVLNINKVLAVWM